jgi:hypothetical protein
LNEQKDYTFIEMQGISESALRYELIHFDKQTKEGSKERITRRERANKSYHKVLSPPSAATRTHATATAFVSTSFQ